MKDWLRKITRRLNEEVSSRVGVVLSWPFPVLAALTAGLFIALVILFLTVAPGSDLEACDLRVDGERVECTHLDRSADVDTEEHRAGTSAPAAEVADTEAPLEGPFVHLAAPRFERTVWSFAAAAVIVAACVAFFPSWSWLKEMEDEYGPAPDRAWSWSVAIGAFLVASWPFGLALTDGPGAILLTVPDWAPWLGGMPAIVGVFGMRSQLNLERPSKSGTRKSIQHVARLRRRLSGFAGVLGAFIAVYVVYFSASMRLSIENNAFQVARLGGEVLRSPNSELAVIAIGAFLTGLLALIFIPASNAIDRVAGEVLARRSSTLAWQTDYKKAREEWSLVRGDLGLGVKPTERLEAALSIGAPLLTAIATQLLP